MEEDLGVYLLDLIFEARKYDDAIYCEDGSLKQMNNIQDIFYEFQFAEQTIYMISRFIDDYDTIYQNMIISYHLHSEFDLYTRRNYVIGLSYSQSAQLKIPVTGFSNEEVGDLINKRWNAFKEYGNIYFPQEFIDDYSFQGILDQTRLECNCRKNKK